MLWIAAALVAIAIVCRGLSFAVPIFDWDEYAFGMSGRSVLTGHLPSAAIFDNKPVGLVYLFALFQAAFGQTVFALRSVGFCAAAITTWLIVRSSTRAGASRAAGLSAAALFLAVAFYEDGWASMSELVLCPFIALANDLVLRADWRARACLFGYGALGGAAFQVSYLALPIFGLMGLAMLVADPPRAIGRMATDTLVAAAGFVAVVLALWLPQAVTGALPAYLAEQIGYTAQYRVPSPPLRESARILLHHLWPLAVPLAVSACTAAHDRAPAPRAVAILAGLAGALVAAFASNRMYAHYFIIVLPSVALVVAMATARAPALRAMLALGVTLAVSAVLMAVSLRHIDNRLTNAPSRAPDAAVIAGMGESDFEVRAAALVDALSRPGQPIYVFDESHVIYYLADRVPANRYVFLTHYLAESDGAQVILPARSLLAQVIAQRPQLLLVGNLVALDFDAGAMARQAHYRACGTLTRRDRHMTIYCRT